MSFYEIHEELTSFINELAKAKYAETPEPVAPFLSLESHLSEPSIVPVKPAKGKRPSLDALKKALLGKIDGLDGVKVSTEKKKALVALVEGLGKLPKEELTEDQKLLTYCRCAHIFEDNGDPKEHAEKLERLFGKAADAFKTLGEYAGQTKSGGGFNRDGQFVHDACLFTLPSAPEVNETDSAKRDAIKKEQTEKEHIALFTSLDSKNAGENIPSISVIVREHPQYYMRKLDVAKDRRDAALGACLGKLTDCCQSIGDAGSMAALHGLTSPYGGFYVIYKKPDDAATPDTMTDTIVAQSWAWRSTYDGLVFDSVERTSEADEDLLIKFYDTAAVQLHTTHGITEVYVGAGGNTPDKLGYSMLPRRSIGHSRDEIGYRADSAQQKILISDLYPYLKQADGLEEDARREKTKPILTQAMQLYQSTPYPPHNDAFMHCLIQHIMNDLSRRTFFDGLLEDEKNKATFDELITVNQAYFDFLKHIKLGGGISIPQLQGLIMKGADYMLVLDDDSTLLHLTVEHHELLKAILNLLPRDGLLAVVKEKDRHENTVLHMATRHPESLKAVLELYPAGERLDAVKEKDKYGNTVLHMAAQYPESLKAIVELLPADKRLDAVKEKDSNGNTVLHLATRHPESLKAVLELLPEADRLDAVKDKDKYGNDVSALIAWHPDSSKGKEMVLELLREKARPRATP